MEILNTVSSRLQYTHITMNTLDYWPMAREYSIWNSVVAALNFWTADLKAHTLGSTTEEVYRTFFYMPSAHTLCQISDKILFGHFVTMLNATFEQKLALEDEGYESSSENFNIPTPLRRTSKIHHISSIENASFDPVLVTPCSTRQPHLRPVCRRLMYSPSDDDDTSEDEVSSPHSMPQVQYPTPDTSSSTSKCTALPLMNTWKMKQMKKRISKLSPWMMNIGPLKRLLTDHYAYMNIHYYTDYVHTCVHM